MAAASLVNGLWMSSAVFGGSHLLPLVCAEALTLKKSRIAQASSGGGRVTLLRKKKWWIMAVCFDKGIPGL